MGQVLIRNLDEEVIAAHREAAARNRRSLEAELRAVLTRAVPLTGERLSVIRDRLEAIRAMTPANITQTPAEYLTHDDAADPA
jgi:plasmid stability protein